MEILGPHFIEVIYKVALGISALSVALLILITIERWFIQRREKHIKNFEKLIVPTIRGYVEGLVTEKAALAAMRKDPPEALSLLIHFAHAIEPELRPRLKPLFTGLILIEDEISALETGKIKRRLTAAERLGFLPTKDSSTALIKALDDETPVIRLCAARSLAIQGRTEAIIPILKSLDLPTELDNRREAETISDYGDSAVPALLSILENTNKKYSSNATIVAARSLGMLKSKEAVQPLIGLLKHPKDSLRLCAARALGEIGDPAAISPVAALANDPAWRVRKKAVKAMGKLNADQQIPRLTNALSDSSWWVRFAAAQALHSLGQIGITELQNVQKTSNDINAREICTEVLEEHELLNTTKA